MGWWVEVGMGNGDGVVGGVRGGGAKRRTHFLINVGNSRHMFVVSPTICHCKKFPTLRHASFFAFASTTQ